ncbi:MAG: hypothetical protein ACREQV_11070, partial [Candidatus Binatia bacterium]
MALGNDESGQPSEALRDQVRRELSRYLGTPADSIDIPVNVDKYYVDHVCSRDNSSVREIFQIMWDLNEAGLRDPTLGTTRRSAITLSRALGLIVGDLLEICRSRPLQYTELGPEPSKTKVILRQLLEGGANVRRYTSVDINPTSREAMREEISELIPSNVIDSRQVLFDQLHRTDYRLSGMMNVVTMLGFEEGNEHPEVVASMLERLLRPGDVVLSEMQLLSPGGWMPIFNFYHTSLMRRFSQLILKRYMPDVESDYAVYLVPAIVGGSSVPSMIAVTAEKISAN